MECLACGGRVCHDVAVHHELLLGFAHFHAGVLYMFHYCIIAISHTLDRYLLAIVKMVEWMIKGK